MSAADDERNVRLKQIELSARRSLAVLGHTPAANPRGVEMRFVMMDSNERFSQREGEGLSRFETDEQGGGQTRTLRGGNGIQFCGGDASLVQSGLRYGQKVSQMFACGKFRNNAAIFSVHLDLR